MGPYVHFELTRDWAEEAGLGDVADRIARADVLFDWQYPARGSLLNLTRHFAPWTYLWAASYTRRALSEPAPEQLGWALHCLQDATAHGVFGLAHIRYQLGLGRDPDDWEAAPEHVRRRIAERSRRLLARYRERWSG
jgi:hypothetical protein